MIRAAVLMVTFVLMVGGHAAVAQTAPQAEPSAPSGKEVFQRKCFQCHAGTMWTTLRGDRTMWLGVLYRMVGLRALWTEAEINAMADFLAQTRGPK
jgi:cytochrome c5